MCVCVWHNDYLPQTDGKLGKRHLYVGRRVNGPVVTISPVWGYITHEGN